ncbi:acyltransferase [Desulfopila sp. IMCC35008]|uniref:acyltransferase family protein n=1 Tax=Desulfopila sp. IMCC35008 TaxID=2653858 RepID=UPI0013D2F19C
MKSTIDILKIVGIIFILLRHVGWYFDFSGNHLLPKIFVPMGELGVNIFLFCSSYGLTCSAINNNYFSLSNYWKKRFVRIYPLYILSLLLYTQFVYHISFSNFLAHAFFLHSFFLELSHNPDPLWYMGVLFQLYLLFPLLYRLIHAKTIYFWLVIASFYILNYLIIYFINISIPFELRLNSNVEDSSIFSYIVPVATGMYVARYMSNSVFESVTSMRNKYLLINILGLLVVLLYVFIKGSNYQSLYEGVKIIFPLISSFVICSFIIWMKIIDLNLYQNKIGIISSGVFCCYLFHEFYFYFISAYITKSYMITPVAICITIILSIYMQRGYNTTIKHIFRKSFYK